MIMRNAKRTLAFLLTVFLLALTAACGGTPATTAAPETTRAAETTKAAEKTEAPETDAPETDAPETDAPETDAPETDAPETEAPAAGYETPIRVSMNVMDAEKNGIDARAEFVEEKFNLTFDYLPVSWGDWNEKIRTWINTGDTPDLIWWDLKGATAWEYQSWARQGAFTAFSDEDFANRPQLQEIYETAESIDALRVDGTLYAWPSLRDNPPEAQNCYTSNWCYRRDWAQEVGLYKEDDIYTFEEWEELIAAVLDAGLAQAGLVMPPWGFPHAAVLFISDPPAEGNETCSYIIDPDTGKYIWPPATDAYVAGVKKTYDMYQAGLIYRDNMSFKASENQDMIQAGQAFATYNVTGSLNTWTADMIKDGTIEKREDFGPAIVSGIDGTWYMTQTEDYWTVTALSKDIDPEAKNRVLDFWDWIITDEGRMVRNFGIEGTDWNWADNEQGFELLWDFDEATKDYISPYAETRFNEATPAENSRVIVPPGSVTYQYDERDRVWAAFASGTPKSAIKPFDYQVSFLSAENKDQFGSFNVEAKAKLNELIAQPDIDIEAEWRAWTDSMAPDVQKVLDELNSLLID